MGSWNSSINDKKKYLANIIIEFLSASNASDARRILELHPELLNKEVDSMFEDLSKDEQSERMIKMIQDYRSFLSLCREVGIDNVFEEIFNISNETSGEDLRVIFEEIDTLTKPQDMPRKIMLLQHSLSLVQCQSNPKLWATLQMELGSSLFRNPQKNRSNQIEMAIEHYNLAIEFLTRQDFPIEWAGLQNNLAIAYSNRIRGEKAENIEQAIEYYNRALEVRTQKDFPVDWAMTQNNLANAYLNRIRGEKANNIEIAIKYCNKALEVRTYKNFSVQWAETQNNLANVYMSRIYGKRTENIETAIEHYNKAIQVYTHDKFPVEWSKAKNNLANAYLERIIGVRAENVEEAIEHYNQALKVRTQYDFPVEWATTQNNLANAYGSRVRGDRAENIETALEHYKNALEVQTHNDFPVEWATTQNNLGTAYKNRIYGDRAENIEQAIEHYNSALEVRTQEDFPVDWAETQNNLANAYRNRIRGDKTENIEKAIEHYKRALEIYTRGDFPVEWATTQNNLANAYLDRILGDKANNIEQAIEHYNQALEVRMQHDFPVDWATTQNNLANAYRIRIRGDIANNIDRSIELYNQALEVYTHDDFPIDWAMTQSNLGIAYRNRIKGDKAENVEQAIERYSQALKVRTEKDFPVDWAETQNKLANAFWSRLRGDRAENIEQAIKHYTQALKIYTYDDFPVDWAMTMNNLGNAYWSRILGNRAENIEKAIEYYEQALEVRTTQDFPVDWAETQNNLANGYWSRILGERADNIEKAIEHYKRALEIYTHGDFPVEWATTQNNLANAYLDRILGDKANNIEQAIENYNQALEVRTQHDFPVDWATTQHNLACAYFARIQGDRTNNIEKAISHCYSALDVYKFGSMPNDFRRTCRLIGDLYIGEGLWEDALGSYKKAIKAGNLLYRSGLSAESKNIEVGENANICRNAALAACRLSLATEALLILEGGKTRLLSEALQLKMKQPKGVPKEEWRKYERAAENYRTVPRLSSQEDYAQREKNVQETLKELDTAVEVVQNYNSEFQKELETSEILSIPDNETALLTFCITDKGSIGLVISKSKGIQLVDIPSFKTEDLNNLLFKTDEQGSITGGWIGNYLSYLNASKNKRYNAFQTWQQTLNDILLNIGTTLFNPLLAKLSLQTKKLILLPSGGLFLLPLHSIPLSNGQLLCQRYCVSYSPSIQLIKEMKNKAVTVEGKGLYAVINPQEDPALVFSGYEGQTISDLFESRQVNVGKTGTRTTVLHNAPGRAYLHFSCHGNYNWNDPLQSGLNLFGGRTLSLEDLQNDVIDISSARLVTLSACETGITDILKGSADEFVGLPAGFMLAGVPCVVSSLWSVPDISTAMLMERFYSNHIVGGMDIPHALQDAQLWVRDLTSIQVAEYVEKCYQSGKWEGKSKIFIEQYRENYLKTADESPEEKPFQHPYYWAAFTVNGA